MRELIFPEVEGTGEKALLDVSTRESRSLPATLNVRLTLPDEKLVALTPAGDVGELPRTNQHGKGLPVAQFQMGLN